MKLEDIGKKDTAHNEKEMPTVIIVGKELKSFISNWVGNKKTPTEGIAEILFELGYRDEETVMLDDFDVNEFSFACSTATNRNMRIKLVPSDLQENAVVITKTEGTEETLITYECINILGDNKEHLKPYSYKIKNVVTGNTLSHTFCQYHWETEVTNINDKEAYTFYIKVLKPRGTIKSETVTKDNFFELENAEQTRKYLLGLTFPISIEEVYKKLCEMSLPYVSEFPNLFISETLKAGKKDPKKTNYIWMSDGRINEFVMTKDGYTVSINDSGEWSCVQNNFFTTGEISVGEDRNGKINYSIITIPEEALFYLDQVSKTYLLGVKKKKEAKTLVKALFGKGFE